MNKIEIMNWQAFKTLLVENPELDLQFQYAEDKWVKASYHITEIKQAPITSVDCGGVMNSWTEIIIQLLEPENQDQLRAMKVKKALSIVDIVERKLSLNSLAIVKIEFGNALFATRQMLPNNVIIDGENLIVDLRPDAVQCKAIDRGGSCGTTANGEECCAPEISKPKIELKNLAAPVVCCEPGAGCC